MNKDQIVARMNGLGDIARERMNASADYPGKVYAEIMHMTQEEVEEMLQLRLMLPSPGQERVEAQARIREKIIKRKEKLMLDQV
jgi:hypothetical protein